MQKRQASGVPLSRRGPVTNALCTQLAQAWHLSSATTTETGAHTLSPLHAVSCHPKSPAAPLFPTLHHALTGSRSPDHNHLQSMAISVATARPATISCIKPGKSSLTIKRGREEPLVEEEPEVKRMRFTSQPSANEPVSACLSMPNHALPLINFT